jgi:intein/homing endonuclease
MISEDKLDTIREFKKFAPKFLVIRTKSGQPKPFEFNRAQRYLHDRLEAQRISTGKVRAVILKGRQAGCSTYIQARFFHQVITSRGKKAFILTHDKEATKNLFSMAQRFYENMEAGLIPKADTENAKELYFKEFDSGYAVGTAGNKSVGRSQTIQLFHGCLAEGSLIFDPINGSIKKIEEFKIGDLVLTHTGEIASISYISSERKECLKVILHGLTAFPLIATENHRFWTKDGWKKLGDFKSDDVIGYPIRRICTNFCELKLPEEIKRFYGRGRQFICSDSIEINYKFGRFIGLYLAEGHIKLQYTSPRLHSSCISFLVHRKELARKIEWISPFADYFSSIKSEDKENRLTSVVTVYGNRFAKLIISLCGPTTGKHLPINWYQMGEEFCTGLLHGYIAGDRHSETECRSVRASSICPAITVSLRDLAASLGYGWASIEFKAAERNKRDRYTFSLCGNGASLLAEQIDKPTLKIINKKTNSFKQYSAINTEISNGYAWLRPQEILYDGYKNVLDFEINHKDHSYCTLQGASHNSEVGYWAFAEEHSKGILQAISNEKGTEVILESTANGIGNYFHSRWINATNPDSEYQTIFLPWYWQDEYTYDAENLKLTDEEHHYMDLYKSNGLTHEHLAWRRIKINDFSKDYDAGKEHFQVEYPFSATEAFRNPIHNVFINSKYVERARREDIEPQGALIIGVDVAISDRDRTAIIRRKGRHAYNLQRISNYNTMEIVGLLKRIINTENPAKVYIDCIGVGAGVVDRLQEMGFSCVEGVNVARSANDKEKFKNLRAELWSDMRDWFYSELPVQIPDEDELHGELCSLGFKENSSGQIQIESKDDLRSRGMPSPDGADALSLSFFGGCYGNVSSQIEVPQLSPWEKGMFR